MAAATANFFLTPNNITSGTWNWGDVAYGFRSGLLLNQTSLSVILYNNLQFPEDLKPQALMPFASIPMTTLGKVAKLARSENWIAHYRQAFVLGAYAVMSANLYAVRTKNYNRKFSQAHTPLQKFLVTVWRMTPYLALLTNIALTILELRVNRMKALVSLTITAVTLLNQAHVIPRFFAWYINPGIRVPMDFIALYYGSNKNRFTIVLGWAGVPIIRDLIKARLKPLLPSSLQDLL